MKSQNRPNKQNRRRWLRDAAIATTSAAVMPSLLTGCADHRVNPGGGDLGGASAPPDDALYPQAAANLKKMQVWYEELHKRNNDYLSRVYKYVKGGDTPPANWKDILIDVFVKIGIEFLEAATEEIPGLGAAIAIAAEEYEKWGSEKSKGGSVDAAFGEFETILGEIYDKVDNRLSVLQDPKPSNGFADYGYLRDAFKNGGSIEFNKRKYTFRDLAEYDFPIKESADFVTLITPAEHSFKTLIWEAIIRKAGVLHLHSTGWQEYTYGTDPRKIISDIYANSTDVSAAYYRAYYDNGLGVTWVMEYEFRFEDKNISDEGVKELFKDDMKGRIINPDALFERDYVFKQFRDERYDFGKYCDVSTEPNTYYDCSEYKFTGGTFTKI